MKKLSDHQDTIAKKKYGKKAAPHLLEDKSIAGLIAANCRKEKSRLFIFRLFVQLNP